MGVREVAQRIQSQTLARVSSSTRTAALRCSSTSRPIGLQPLSPSTLCRYKTTKIFLLTCFMTTCVVSTGSCNSSTRSISHCYQQLPLSVDKLSRNTTSFHHSTPLPSPFPPSLLLPPSFPPDTVCSKGRGGDLLHHCQNGNFHSTRMYPAVATGCVCASPATAPVEAVAVGGGNINTRTPRLPQLLPPPFPPSLLPPPSPLPTIPPPSLPLLIPPTHND